MSVGTALSRARSRPAPPLLGPAVVWNVGAPAWSVAEVCPWVRLLERGAGLPEAGGVGVVGVLRVLRVRAASGVAAGVTPSCSA